MSFIYSLFGCATDEATAGNGTSDSSIRPASAMSPEDEALNLRGLPALRAKLKTRGASDAATAAFAKNYEAMIGGDTGLIGEDKIEAVDQLPELESVKCVSPMGRVHVLPVRESRAPLPSARTLALECRPRCRACADWTLVRDMDRRADSNPLVCVHRESYVHTGASSAWTT